MPLSHNDLKWFAARLSIAVYEANRITPEMSAFELREALRGVPGSEDLTISRAPNGNQVIHLGDRDLEVGPTASNDEIITALQNPFIRTENTRMAIIEFKPGDVKGALQRIKDRQSASLAKLAAVAAKSEDVANKLDAIADDADKKLDTALSEAGQFSNLGPDLDPH